MDKQVPHYCDCPHCTVEFDIVTVKEGPITESQHRMNQLMHDIYAPQIKKQLEESMDFFKAMDDGRV
jgi:hypothetical protein